MLDLFLNFFKALSDAIPKLYELYRDNQQEEKIVELLESYFILGDLIYSAEELLLVVRNKDKVDLWFDNKTTGLTDRAKIQLKQSMKSGTT